MIDPKGFYKYNEILTKLLEGTPQAEMRAVHRHLARTDLYFLLRFILNKKHIENPWLWARCKEVEKERYETIDIWAREHMKALCCYTPVLTANRGWVKHIDLKPFDRVFAPSGEQVRVIANTGVMHGQTYEVKTTDRGSLIASGNHMWTMRRKHKLRISGTDQRRITYSDYMVKTEDLERLAYFPDVQPLRFKERHLPIKPYLFGYWLGDGTKGSSQITVGYQDIDEVKSIFDDELIPYSTKDCKRYVRLSVYPGVRGKKGSNSFTNHIKSMGALNNKHIPDEYLYSSPDQRFQLLQGLMDSDGTTNSRGTAYFSNKLKSLAEGVYYIVRSLGYPAYITKYRGYYIVQFQGSSLKCFRIKRKLANCEDRSFTYKRQVKSVEKHDIRDINCIQVEGGNYLAGKDFIPTHNSTIITNGATIQDIIASHGENPLERFKGEEITVGIFSHTRKLAKDFLREIKQEFEENQQLKDLFPDVLYDDPKSQSPKWSEDDGVIVKRKSIRKEATVEAWGLTDGMPTGKHFWLLNYDDIVTDKSVTSEDMIKKTTDSLSLSYNLGSHGGHKRVIGTYYHFNDTLRQLVKQGVFKLRLYPATHNGELDGNPVFLSKEEYEKKRRESISSYIFACQILLNPIADDAQSFDEDWLKYADSDGSGMNIYLIVDPASEKKKNSDYTVMSIVALGADGNRYLLDGIRDRLNLSERWKMLEKLHRKWQPVAVGYEKYGMQSDIEYFKEKMEQENYRFEIIPLGGNMAKNDRIRRLVGPFENGNFYIKNKISQRDYEKRYYNFTEKFENEYKEFPMSGHDDVLDSVSRIMDPDLGAKFPRNKKRAGMLKNFNKYDALAW